MRALERVLERARLLVGGNGWDYCIVWKLGDYSTRYIEMMGCCCGGAKETEMQEEEKEFQLCKDMVIPHPQTTKACDALADLPTFIPISFGIHVDVLIAGQPRWICADEMNGTRVLIPVVGGLIEFFAEEQVPKDPEMMELMMVHCNEEQEVMIACLAENLKEQLIDKCMKNVPHSDDGNRFLDLQSTANNQRFLEGSATGSISLVEPFSYEPTLVCASLGQTLGSISPLVETSMSTPPEYDNIIQQANKIVSGSCDNKEAYLMDLKKRVGESQKSRNLLIERNRRNKLKSKILTLRALVPNITKMDIQATLGDASSYIEDLQKRVKAFQDELKDNENAKDNELKEEANENAELENQKVSAKTKTDNYVTSHLSPTDISTDQSKHNHDSLISNDLSQQMEETVEVRECSRNEFSLKLIFWHKRSWFRKLMEALYALGLDVTEANVITIQGRVMTIFKAEAKKDDIEALQLKDSLLELIQNGLLMDKP